jgi:hypothetical protein
LLVVGRPEVQEMEAKMGAVKKVTIPTIGMIENG